MVTILSTLLHSPTVSMITGMQKVFHLMLNLEAGKHING